MRDVNVGEESVSKVVDSRLKALTFVNGIEADRALCGSSLGCCKPLIFLHLAVHNLIDLSY